jgi:flagellar biosynthetic protein FliR
MALDAVLNFIPVFVLVFFRLAGLMLFAPLLGSARIPRRIKALLALVLAMCLSPLVAAPPRLPETNWDLALGIGGEMAFGVAMGMILSFVFIAVQWGGELIGQQMGLNLGEVFDPQFGASGSLIGELYFMLAMATFLFLGGHLEMIRAVKGSFDALPLLSLGIDQTLLDLLMGLFAGASSLAIRLAAPVLITMLVVDLALGFIGKTIPQLNVMSAGLTLRSLIGIAILIVSLTSASELMGGQILSSIQTMAAGWARGSG